MGNGILWLTNMRQHEWWVLCCRMWVDVGCSGSFASKGLRECFTIGSGFAQRSFVVASKPEQELQVSSMFIIFDLMKLTTQDEKLRSELIEKLQTIESRDLLQEVRAILYRNEPKKDFWDELSVKQQAMVRKGLAELKAGKGIPAEEVLRRLKK
jgi:hypothetical protein